MRRCSASTRSPTPCFRTVRWPCTAGCRGSAPGSDAARAAAVPGDRARVHPDRAHGRRWRHARLVCSCRSRLRPLLWPVAPGDAARAAAARRRARRGPADLAARIVRSMIEVPDTERELRRIRLRLAFAWFLVLGCFGILVGALRLPADAALRRFPRPGRGQPHRAGADSTAPRPDLRPQRRAARRQRARIHARDRAQAGGDLEHTIDELSEVVEISPRDRRRFKRLLEDSRSTDRVPMKIRLTEEEVARLAVRSLPLPRRGDPRAAVPQLPARRRLPRT